MNLLPAIQLRAIVRASMHANSRGLALYATDTIVEQDTVIIILVFRHAHVMLTTTFTETVYTIYPNGKVDQDLIKRTFKK